MENAKKRKAAPATEGMDADLLAYKRAQSRKSSQRHRMKQQMLEEEMAKKQRTLHRENEDIKAENEKMKEQIALLKGYGYGQVAASTGGYRTPGDDLSVCTGTTSKTRADTIVTASSICSSTAASSLSSSTGTPPLQVTPRLELLTQILATAPTVQPAPAVASLAQHPSVVAAVQEAVEAIRVQKRIATEQVRMKQLQQELLVAATRHGEWQRQQQEAASNSQSTLIAALLASLAPTPTLPASNDELLIRSFLNRASTVVASPPSVSSLRDLTTAQIEQLILLRLQELNGGGRL